jgi:mRNA-degrading endonuclease RelE of RelBE toxin-antitoxin system
MAREKGLSIDPRVNIAMDALSLSQREAVSKLLRDREHFLNYAGRPGRTQKLLTGKTLYKTRVGSSGLRLIYSTDGDMISVLDLMNKRTMDLLGPKKKKKSGSPKKNASHTIVE